MKNLSILLNQPGFNVLKPFSADGGVIEQHILLGTNAGKHLSYAATDVLSTLVLKKWTNI